MRRIAGRFTRVESRRRARKLVLGLLSHLPRKNCWTIAEWAGDRTPDGMQHLLGRAKWDADQVRDELGDCVVEHLHAVYLVHVGRRGHAALDRELYVPRSWTSDPDRCRGRRPR